MTVPELTREYEKKDTVFLDDFARGSFDVPVRDLVTFTASTPVSYTHLDVYKRQALKRLQNSIVRLSDALLLNNNEI